MQVNVIHGGTVDSFNYLAFPEQSPAVANYIQNQLNGFSQSLTDIGRNFIEASRAIYERVNDSNAIRMAKAAIRMAKGVFHPNDIVPLETLEEIRAAQPIMQRYIMAEPMLRGMYHRQQIDGYSDTYADVDPGQVGDKHYDWRRIMTGIVQDKVSDDGEDYWVSRNFYDEARLDDVPLDIVQKVAIMNTMDLARMFMEAGKDPTDIFGKS